MNFPFSPQPGDTYSENGHTWKWNITVPGGAWEEVVSVTDITGTDPISVIGGVVSISSATTSSAGSMSAADKAKLDGVAAAADVNVQADWGATTGGAVILRKPALGTAAGKNIPVIGDASLLEVVLGNDTRLINERVPSYHVHSSADITDATDLATASTVMKRDSLGAVQTLQFKAVSSGGAIGCLSSNSIFLTATNGGKIFTIDCENLSDDFIVYPPNGAGTLAITASTTGVPDALTNGTISGTLTFTGMDVGAALAIRNAAGLGTSDSPSFTGVTATGTVTAARFIEGVTALGTVVSTATITITGGTHVTATLTASTACTFTLPAAAAGLSFIFSIKQAAATGNGTATFTGVVWSGGTAPTITATAGKMDILSFVSGPNAAGSGYTWYASALQNVTPP